MAAPFTCTDSVWAHLPVQNHHIIISYYITWKNRPEIRHSLSFCAVLPLCVSDQEVDELLRRAPGCAAASQLPLVGLLGQFRFGERDLRVLLGQFADDVQIFLMRRLEIADRDAEARHQRQLLLHRIAAVHLVVGPVASVAPGLPDQMPSVGGGVDQHIVRLHFQISLNHRLQVFEFCFCALKGQVIHVDDKPVIAALDNADDVDVIVTSTGAPHYVVKTWQTKQLMTRRAGRRIFFIDIAVPRDVDPDVGKIPGVTLYNIDDLESVVESNKQARKVEAVAAEKIIDEFVQATMDRFKYLKFQPLMADLSNRAEKIREREIKRVANKLSISDDDKKIIDNMTKMIVRKLLRLPMMKLNSSAGTVEEKFYTDAIRALFRE